MSIHWAVMVDGHATEYDDEQDAREHLPLYPPDAFLVSCEVSRTPWERAQ